jgi:hypothetical protein
LEEFREHDLSLAQEVVAEEQFLLLAAQDADHVEPVREVLLAVDVDVVLAELIRGLARDCGPARECFLFGEEHRAGRCDGIHPCVLIRHEESNTRLKKNPLIGPASVGCRI